MNLHPGITMLIGTNGVGKTAFLDALALMFGVTRQQRTVRSSDFYGAQATSSGSAQRDLSIDVRFGFPELADGTATPETIAPSFRHMLIEAPGTAPVCRMRLEAHWTDDHTGEGDVRQDLFWVTSLDEIPPDTAKPRVLPADRTLVRLYYAPASRDAAAEIKATTGALASRLLRAVMWSEKTRTTVDAAASSIQAAFSGEHAIAAINSALGMRWQSLYEGSTELEPALNLVTREFDEIIRRLGVAFSSQVPYANLPHEIDELSEGQQSLFYFALVAAVFDVEQQIVQNSAQGFNTANLHTPALSLFSIEEPENHLSPFYLARIMRELRSVTKGHRAQGIMTSHSPAILGRVTPDEVRYLRRERFGASAVRVLAYRVTHSKPRST